MLSVSMEGAKKIKEKNMKLFELLKYKQWLASRFFCFHSKTFPSFLFVAIHFSDTANTIFFFLFLIHHNTKENADNTHTKTTTIKRNNKNELLHKLLFLLIIDLNKDDIYQ